jgi:hypothetical protein
MTATRDIRLLVCDEQSAYRDEVHKDALVAEGGFWVCLKGFCVAWGSFNPGGLSLFKGQLKSEGNA